jgi:uroporphyrinogen-III synthase
MALRLPPGGRRRRDRQPHRGDGCGRIDALAFTSAAQVGQLFALAGTATAATRLRDALARTKIAAVGPVVAAELERHGLAVAIMPEGPFFMKPLVSAIIAALAP